MRSFSSGAILVTIAGRRLCAFVRQADALAEAGKIDESEQFLAFALGYITHLGTDTVAHSFVNEQCGGPFRNHPQRHHLIENHIDAWNYSQTGTGGANTPDPWCHSATYPDASMSALWFAVQMTPPTAKDPNGPKGKQRPDPLPADPKARKKALDVDGEMPNWMANSIVMAMMDTFRDPAEHPQIFQGDGFQSTIDAGLLTKIIEDVTGSAPDRPFPELLKDIAPPPPFSVRKGFPLPWEVKMIYKIMITFYRLSFNGTWELEKPRKPDFIIFPPASDIENLLQPPDLSGIDPSNPVDDICGLFIALIEWAIKSLDAALKLVEDLIKMLASPGSYLLRLGLYELASVCPTRSISLLLPWAAQLDAPFRAVLAAAFDPLGNLDQNQDVIGIGHSVSDPNYPYYPVLRYHTDGSFEGWEYDRPWAWPERVLYR